MHTGYVRTVSTHLFVFRAVEVILSILHGDGNLAHGVLHGLARRPGNNIQHKRLTSQQQRHQHVIGRPNDKYVNM